ncbi:uncharacterized protein [Arachis hypogaea]|uniref:uncharacterized protein n=1 Tax=Arachis hypogaea TaxID=3818 RepID=UPI003B21AC43
MTCSTAKSLVQLTTMKIAKCGKLNEIVTKDEEGNDEEIKIVFAKLITIQLEGLSNLKSFCSNLYCEFWVSLLEKLILSDCPNMKTFTAKHIRAPKLKSVLVRERFGEEEKGYWEGDLNATIQMIDKKLDSHKTHLFIGSFAAFKSSELQVWRQDKTLVQVNMFRNVKSLVVKRCDYLAYVIPFHLLHCFKNLENLEVADCDAVQVIFNMNDDSSNKVTTAMGMSRLKKVSLENLPNLTHVWDTDPKGMIHFQVLQDLRVDRCDSLEYVFPSSMPKDFVMLKTLSINNCDQLVKIFAKDKTVSELEDTPIKIVFDSLSFLYLSEVPLLKYFYPGLHRLQFPNLKELYIQVYKWMVFDCQEAKTSVEDQQVLIPLEQFRLTIDKKA